MEYLLRILSVCKHYKVLEQTKKNACTDLVTDGIFTENFQCT